MSLSRLSHARYEYIQKPEATKLHTVDVWLPNSPADVSPNKKWIVFIHGGAWRDPEIDSTALKPALEILSTLCVQKSIAGFASINHRLSPYPDHPIHPSSPDDRSRNAKHPDHFMDVSNALIFLQEKYGIGNGFLLVGHSAGATIAFQIREQYCGISIPIPEGVLGVEGIYDIPKLVQAYESVPAYREFIENAFGHDKMVWYNASPASSKQPTVWEKAKAIIIAYSDEDELLNKMQADLMLKRLHQSASCKEKSHFFPATGRHDSIWKDGHELARLIENAIMLLCGP